MKENKLLAYIETLSPEQIDKIVNHIPPLISMIDNEIKKENNDEH